MNELADHLEKTLATGNVGVVVHVGAGNGAELPIYLAAKPAHIRLLEPNPTAVKALQLATSNIPSVTVDARALAGHNGTAKLRIFNLASLSSLRDPHELTRLFPGLYVVSEQEVTTVKVSSFMEELPLAEGHRNILILDAPGEEERIVEDLRAGQWFRRFDHVFLHGGASQLYKDSPVVHELLRWLEAEGFRLETTVHSDPDRPCLVLRLERSFLEQIKALEAERDKAKADLGMALQTQALLQSDIDELRPRYEQVEKARADQELLLRKLTPWLREAARNKQTMQYGRQAALASEVEPTGSKPSKSRATARKSGKENPSDVQ